MLKQILINVISFVIIIIILLVIGYFGYGYVSSNITSKINSIRGVILG